MKRNLSYVGGSKGGTGKSMFSMALIDYHRKKYPGGQILLAEADTSNPDVGRLYGKRDRIMLYSTELSQEEGGWISLLDKIDEATAQHIIVNSMAASNLGIRAQGQLLESSLNSLQVDFKVFWVMNRTKDSVTLLRDFLQHIKGAVVYPVRNQYFGKEDKFAFYDNSRDLHEMIASRGGYVLDMPDLYDLTTDRLYTDEITFEDLPKHLSHGSRTSLERWLNFMRETLDKIYSSEEQG